MKTRLVLTILLLLFVRPPAAFADSVLYAAHTPAVSNYVSSCNGLFHGVAYCEFTSSFSISSNQTAIALTWYDLGCALPDGQSVTLFYELVNADTYAIVATTTESAQVTCSAGYPPGHNHPTTLAITPTTLVANQNYFLVLREVNDTRDQVYWGTDAAHNDSFQVLNPLDLGTLTQLKSDGSTPIVAGSMITENTMVLRGVPSNSIGNQVQIQVELRRITEALTGEPTASSGFVTPGQPASITIFGLIDGVYHWRMRTADNQGNVSNWQDFGGPGSFAFEVFASPLPATFPIPNPSCRGNLVTFVPYAPMVLKGANFWTSCHDTPQSYIGCYGMAYSQVFDGSGSTLLAQSASIQSFGYTQNAYDLNYTTTFSGANQITLQPGVTYAFTNVETDGSYCTPGPYHPNSAYLEIAPPPAPPVSASSLHQYKSDATTAIPEGGTTGEDEVVFAATLQSSSGHELQLEVEYTTRTTFTGTPNATSSAVSPGSLAKATAINLQNGSYRWRARAVDIVTNAASGWQEFGTAGNIDFVVNNLGQDAAGLALLVLGDPYLGDGDTFGGKGWDPIANTYVTPDQIGGGYTYWNNKLRQTAFGAGLDCSGLVEWTFDRSFDPLKTLSHNAIRYEGASGQYLHNSVPVAESDLRPGDLLFFGTLSSGGQISAGHVAMYVGDHGTFDVVHAAAPHVGIVTARKDLLKTAASFLGFRHVVLSPAIGGSVQAGSPIDLTVTDPDGLTITAATALQTSEEYLREVAGELYYYESVLGPDGRPAATVYWPDQKTGDYLVQATPQAGASPTATYSLTFQAGYTTIALAQDLPVSQIPSQGYGITVSAAGPVSTFIPVAIDIKPGSYPPSINLKSKGVVPVAILGSATFDVQQIDPATVKLANAAVALKGNGQPMASYEDVNGDGIIDLVVHVPTQALQLTPADVRANLIGFLLDGREIKGSGSIRIAP
jgi:cell wall-associated NlpC family hydrolase